MRTLTADQEEIYSLSHRKVDLDVSFKNNAGTWVSFRNQENRNWIVGVNWGENLDQPVGQCTISLNRNDYWLSLAPLVTGSKMNIIETQVWVGREVRIRTATIPMDYEPVEADWENVFEGRIDDVQWPTGVMSIACRDRSGILQDRIIEKERVQGADDLSVDAEDVMQNILTTSQTGITLACPVASSWAIKAYIQQRMQILPALDTIAQQLAWQVRQKWDALTSSWKLTFFEPDRWKAVEDADRSFDSYEIMSISDIGISLPNIRNIIEITYIDAADNAKKVLQYPENGPAYGDVISGGPSTLNDAGKAWETNVWIGFELWIVDGTGKGQHQTISANTATQLTVDTPWDTQPDSTSFYCITYAQDSAESYIRYGRRFCGIAESATKQVDSPARAVYMARRIYADVNEPTVQVTFQLPYFHAVELGDLYTLEANGVHFDYDLTLGVVDFKHNLQANDLKTTITLRGMPSGGYRKWFSMEFRPGVAQSPHVEPPLQPTAPDVTSGIKNLSLTWTYILNAYYPMDYFEIEYATEDAEYNATNTRYEVPVAESWSNWAAVPGGTVKTFNYTFNDADVTKVYRFRIRFKDTNNLYSEWSAATIPTAGTTEGVPQQIQATDTSEIVQVALTNPAVRQCISSGAVSDGIPSFAAIGTGLNVNLLASETIPLSVAMAFGDNENGTVDYLARYKANVTSAWTVPPNSYTFLYVDRAKTVDGTITQSYAPTPCQYGPEFDKSKNVLMHFDGTNGGTTFTEEYGNTITRGGSAALTTVSKKFGTASLSLNGTSWIDIGVSCLGRDAWIIEGWFRFLSLPTDGATINILRGTTPYSLFVSLKHDGTLGGNVNLNLSLSTNGTSWNLANAVVGAKTNWVAGTWYKLALVFKGAVYRLYVGEAGGPTTIDIAVTSSTPIWECGAIRVGANNSGTSGMSGNVDEVRFTSGSYRTYGNNFTPEASAFSPDVHWYDTAISKMKTGGPSGWTEVIRGFVGEATSNATTVTEVVCYAIGTTFETPWEAYTNGDSGIKTAYYGYDPRTAIVNVLYRRNANYTSCPAQGYEGYGQQRGAIASMVTRNDLYIYTAPDYISPLAAAVIGASPTNTETAGDLKIIMTRNF